MSWHHARFQGNSSKDICYLACQRSIPSGFQKKFRIGEMTSWPVSENTPWGTVSRSGTGTGSMVINLINTCCFKAAILNCCYGNQGPGQPDIVPVNKHCVMGFFSPFRFALPSFSSQRHGVVFTDYHQVLWKKIQCNFLLRVALKWSHPLFAEVMTLTLFCGG